MLFYILFLYFSLSLSLSLSVPVYVCPFLSHSSVFLPLCFCLFFYTCWSVFCQSVCLSYTVFFLCLYLSASFCLSLYFSTYVYASVFVSLSVSIFLSVSPCVSLSLSASVYCFIASLVSFPSYSLSLSLCLTHTHTHACAHTQHSHAKWYYKNFALNIGLIFFC